MTLKERLDAKYNVDLPISGGFGVTLETAIVIEKPLPCDYVLFEHTILDIHLVSRGLKWKLLGQTLMCSGSRTFDEMEVEVTETVNDQKVTRTETIYFDITAHIQVTR